MGTKKVQVGNDQEKAQSERIPTPKTEVRKNMNTSQPSTRHGGSNEYPQSVCFASKLRKIGIPLHTPVSLYKSGVKG